MKLAYKLICTLLIGLFCFSSSLFAQEIVFPSPRGYINDFANLISLEDSQKLNSLAAALEQKTTAELSVVTLKTIKPYEIQDYSVRLFEQWKIGKAGKDNGILLLVAIDDKEVWITTGYGLEGAIPDAEASKVYRNIIVP
ncbi:MAG: TPM domain-containing protein, partial [Omnitrophica bacterium]|nr:TPM domain-containing protein [Candidatus Omnitrophota bacterium]